MKRAAALGLLVCAAAGCTLGSGTGTVAGGLFVVPCVGLKSIGASGAPAAFDLQPTFFVADMLRDLIKPVPNNRVSIRVQSAGNLIEEADVLFVSVDDVYAVASAIDTPITLGPASNVRASLSLKRSCPNAPVNMELDGTMTFSSFGKAADGGAVPIDFFIDVGDELTARFDLDVVDRRAIVYGGDASVGGHLSGFFDFQVRKGRAAQTFP